MDRWISQRRPVWRRSPVLLGVVAALVTMAAGCGPDVDEPGLGSPDELDVWYNEEPLNAMPRYFPAPENRFFDDPRITAVDPDPDERIPMILSSRSYWMPDDHAMTITYHSDERMVFPLRGNEPLLAYKEGHIILNKWFVMRHEILNVEVTNDHIIWDVQPSEIEDVILQASFYLDIEPETPYPFGFDPMDVYLFENRAHQLEVIKELGLNYGLLNPANIERLDRGEAIKLDPHAERLRAQRLGLEMPDVAVQRQALEAPSFCSQFETGSDPAETLFNCTDYVTENIDEFRAMPPQDGGTPDHSACDPDRNPDGDECLCAHFMSAEECYSLVCDDTCLLGAQDCTSDAQCPGDQTCSFDIVFDSNDNVISCSGENSTRTVGDDDQICVNSESGEGLTWHLSPGTCGVSANDGLGAEDDFEGGFPMSGGLAFCLNTDVLPTDVCPFGGEGPSDVGGWDPDIEDVPSFDYESRFLNVSCGLDGAGVGGGGAALRASCGLELGPSLFQLAIYPVFMAAVGIKAKFKIKFWKPKVELRIGVYAGVGYGFSAGLFLANIGGSGSDSDIIYWSDIGKQAFGPIPVVFLQLELDPYVRVDYYIQSSIGGSIVYDYYKEHWFYVCLRVGTSGIKFDTGDKARSRCGLPNMDDRPEYDGWRETRLHAELQAGLTVGLGLELRLYQGSKRTGLWFEPIRAIANFNASLRAPLCTWNADLRFGGLFGFGIKIPIVGRLSKEWRWRWPIPEPIAFSGVFMGGFWESFFGCFQEQFGNPFEGEILECDTDAVCQDYYESATGEARCFARECVEHDEIRFSLAWFTPTDQAANPKGAALTLFVKDPEGTVHHAGTDPEGAFYRHDTGMRENAGRHIVNAAFPVRIDRTMQETATPLGDYEFWVAVTNPDAVLGSDFLPTAISYTVEVEVEGQFGTRQEFSGTIDLDAGSTTPTVFSLCTPPDDEQFCTLNGFCGRIQENDACGNFREVDCGFCSFGAWQLEGDSNSGDWTVSEDGQSVYQSINGQPTMYVSNQSFMNTRLKGTFRVDQNWDDDFVGFVFGYQGPRGNNYSDWDTLVFSWKKANQGGAQEGFALGYVNGGQPNWAFVNSGTLEVLGTSYGSNLGWEYDTDYMIEVIYEPSRIQIFVCPNTQVSNTEFECPGSAKVIDVTASQTSFAEFPEGSFGFYNHSQANVRYSNFITYPLDL